MFFLVLSYGHQYHFATNTISLRFPFHLSRGVHWGSRKMLFELSEAFVYWCFEEITAPKISAYFPEKHPGWSPF